MHILFVAGDDFYFADKMICSLAYTDGVVDDTAANVGRVVLRAVLVGLTMSEQVQTVSTLF